MGNFPGGCPLPRILLAAVAVALACPALAQSDKPVNSIQGQYDASRDPGRFDLDHDGTLTLAEVKSAAAYRFDKLDADHDGTLTRREISGRVSPAGFRQANPDKDGTLDKAEYLKLVEQRFDVAAGGPDKTIATGALAASDAGKRLSQLMQ